MDEVETFKTFVEKMCGSMTSRECQSFRLGWTARQKFDASIARNIGECGKTAGEQIAQEIEKR